MKNKLRVIELFAGIGAPRKALMRGGYNFEIVNAIEIDKYPVASYNAIYNDNIKPISITDYYPKKEDIGEIDLVWNSSPCQDISLAGKGAGAIEGSGTRSSLIYEVIRIVKEIQPKYIIWENVRGLLANKHKPILDDYISKLENLGYRSYYQVLNAKDYNIPQNRERIFVVSIRNDICNNYDFIFPKKKELTYQLQDIFVKNVDEYFYNICPSMLAALDSGKVKDITNNNYSQTLTTKQARWNNAGLVLQDGRYRYLTPKECWRLMGFDDEDYDKAEKVSPMSQLYKQAGNSVVVNVIEAIFDELLKDYK